MRLIHALTHNRYGKLVDNPRAFTTALRHGRYLFDRLISI